MGPIKFFITLWVIYLIFRAVMKKALGMATSPEKEGALKGKIGDVVGQIREEIRKAQAEAQREKTLEDQEDPWTDFRHEEEEGAFEETLWDEAPEESSLWDQEAETEDMAPTPGPSALKKEPSPKPPESKRPVSARRRLREAVVWKEILDAPIALRNP